MTMTQDEIEASCVIVMLRIMANENMEEWSNNASIMIETIRAVAIACSTGGAFGERVTEDFENGQSG